MSTPRRNKRKVLTLEDRVKVIEQSNKGMSAASISRLIMVFKIIHAPAKRPPLSYDRFYVAVPGVA